MSLILTDEYFLRRERDGSGRNRNTSEISSGADIQDSENFPRYESHRRDNKVQADGWMVRFVRPLHSCAG